MHKIHKLKEMLCEQLEDYADRELSPTTLQYIDTLAHAVKNIDKIIECEEGGEYSMNSMYGRNMRRSYDGESNRGYSDGGYYYDDGMSTRRGRGANGRFVSRDGNEMARKLREMMNDAPNDNLRQELQRLMDKVENM